MAMLSDELERFLKTPEAECTYSHYSAAANALRTMTAAQTLRPELRVAVVRNFTAETLLPVIAGEVFRAGFHPDLYVGDFDAISADALNPASALYAFAPDFVVMLQWLETLSPTLSTRFVASSSETVASEVERVQQQTKALFAALRKHSKAAVLVNNFPLPAETTLGILDGQASAFQTHTTIKLNAALAADAEQVGAVYVLDFMRLFAAHGAHRCLDERHWHMARAPLSSAALVPIGREIGRFVRALRGKTKKCLVLDCDNTLWGGIVGEDGMAGIKLGRTYPGSCFLAFQEEILNLHDRGVILALCSKNNANDVLQVLRDHPDMLLREKHFATMQINWDDKVTNLKRIARELNIGIDSFVFVDDSEFETQFVRENLPEVEVIQVPKHTAGFRAEFTRRGLFDSLTFSSEDRRRNEMYVESRQRAELEASSSSLDEFLAKLELEVDIGTPSEFEIPRVAQLTQKTNQFNLTTRRYSEGDIRGFLSSGSADVIALKVRDRIAEMGLVGVAIVTYRGAVAEIDSFLLSCRVIGRGVEDALLSTVVNQTARAKGAKKVVGRYVATAKNGQVQNFYGAHNFKIIADSPEGKLWEHEVGPQSVPPPAWIKIRNGLLDASK